MKKVLYIIILGAIIIFGTQYIFSKSKDEKSIEKEQVNLEETLKESTEESKIKENKEYRNIEIKSIQIYEELGNTYFIADVENNSEEVFIERNVTIDFITSKRESIAKFRQHIGQLKPGEKMQIKIITTEKIKDAYDFKIID